MAQKKVNKQDQELESVNEALSQSGQWIEEHQKAITIGAGVVVAVVLGVMAVYQWVIKPNRIAASNENATAEVIFAQAEQAAMQGDTVRAKALFEKALNGVQDSDTIGFLEVADNYSNQQAELAALYAGVCYAELGQMEEAAEYLNKFSASDITVGDAAQMRLGDVYVELGELEKAAKAFEKAAKGENDVIAPMALMKAGRVYLKLENKEAAKTVFETVKTKFFNTQEAQEVEKYLPMCD